MKVLCAWCDSMAVGDTYERINVFPALEKLGHEVKVFPLVNSILSYNKPLKPLDVELLEAVDDYKPDLLIYQLYQRIISPETIKYINDNTKVTTLIICGDDEKYYEETKQYAPHTDNIVTTYLPAYEKHKKHSGRNVIHAGYSANPVIFKKLNIKKTTDLSFYGAATDYRIAVLNGLLTNDIPIRVYGNSWRDDSIITTAECVYLINETKVNLNISIDVIDKVEISQIKARDFEVPMCGGFLLTHDNPLLEQFYDIGKEIVTYTNFEDMVFKIKKYIKDDRAREKIAEHGYKRARNDHKTVTRWRDIFKKCYYKPGGSNGAV